jgi:predicted nicotinamide N-methyase
MTDAKGVEDFIRANTEIVSPPLVPEIRLHLATEITPIWQATEAELETAGLPPPFWAFCWPGGQAVARYVLDAPETVLGRKVLDFACGSAVSGIAAARAGAARVVANDIDGFALTATRLNAALNGVSCETVGEDLLAAAADAAADYDVVFAGDIFYERPLAAEVEHFLRGCAARGADVLIGDPGRKYLPGAGLEEVARYDIPTTLELETRDVMTGAVLRVLPG